MLQNDQNMTFCIIFKHCGDRMRRIIHDRRRKENHHLNCRTTLLFSHKKNFRFLVEYLTDVMMPKPILEHGTSKFYS